MNPVDRHYSSEHEWAKREVDGSVQIGITEFAQEQLGDIVFVELPSAGVGIAQMQKIGEVESVKSVSDIFSPISGQVIEANQSIIENPELVNQDPYGDGWLIRVLPSKLDQLDQLMSAGEYELFLNSLDH
jgi:glycine cleavage system H protein